MHGFTMTIQKFGQNWDVDSTVISSVYIISLKQINKSNQKAEVQRSHCFCCGLKCLKQIRKDWKSNGKLVPVRIILVIVLLWCSRCQLAQNRSVQATWSQTLRTRPEDVWVVAEVAGGSTVAESSSGPRGSDAPLLLSRGSPFNRASRLLPSAAPNASRFRPSSKSATHQAMHVMALYEHRRTHMLLEV